MSAIGPSGSVPQMNPYAGNLNSTRDSDSSRTDSAGRAVEADQAQFGQNLAEPGETGRSEDRDADGFFTPGGSSNEEGSPADGEVDATTAEADAGNASDTPTADQPLDDHRGNLINFDV